jgi:hypothetical protein
MPLFIFVRFSINIHEAGKLLKNYFKGIYFCSIWRFIFTYMSLQYVTWEDMTSVCSEGKKGRIQNEQIDFQVEWKYDSLCMCKK